MMLANRMLDLLVRTPGFLGLWSRLQWGSLPLRVRYGAWSRPHYAYGVFAAADLAKRLGLSAISVIEFGVAGGNGLVALEQIAKLTAAHFGITIAVYGFDAGTGMPAPQDYRDLPHVWDQGFYKMNEAALRARLSSAQLFIGNVAQTIPAFAAQSHPPIGFVSFDLDYYSSTKAALTLFDAPPESRLPRVYGYMDDIIWPEYACHNEYIGELLAIREFNAEHAHLKLCKLHLLRHMRRHAFPWNDQIYVLHDFLHPLYAKNITGSGAAEREIPLTMTTSA
ncbi:MAG TPA: hypothetical protein VGM97_00385 [Steroidobacteraceae bacterium]|jgi:hypothetical protein